MFYHDLQSKRSCALEKTCVAESEKQVVFNMQGVFGGITGEEKKPKHGGGQRVKMTCHTLSAILERYDVKHVDYLNLDVEGVELECLQGVRWDQVRIDVIGIENNPGFENI